MTDHRVQECSEGERTAALLGSLGKVKFMPAHLSPTGKGVKSSKHSTAIRAFFETTYFLMCSAAPSSVFFNVIGVCGHKIPHHKSFNAR